MASHLDFIGCADPSRACFRWQWYCLSGFPAGVLRHLEVENFLYEGFSPSIIEFYFLFLF